MARKQRDPGALIPGAGRDWFAATSRTVDSNSDLQAQRLVRVHNINPALAPTLAALAWAKVQP